MVTLSVLNVNFHFHFFFLNLQSNLQVILPGKMDRRRIVVDQTMCEMLQSSQILKCGSIRLTHIHLFLEKEKKMK